MWFHPSFRIRILLVVVVVAVIPLGLVGVWLTRSTARSGEQILRGRLSEALDRASSIVIRRWVEQRSALLFLAEEERTQAALSRQAEREPAPSALVSLFEGLGPGVARVVVRDSAGEERWRLERGTDVATTLAGTVPTTLAVSLDMRDHLSGRMIGTLDADVRVEALSPPGASSVSGIIVGLFDSDGVALTPTPIDPTLLEGDNTGPPPVPTDTVRPSRGRFLWAGDAWLTDSRTLAEPPVRIVAAAPFTPFAEPVARASRQGLWALLVVALGAVAAAAVITGRLTRSLHDLSEAADAVSRGELGYRVNISGNDEVKRVAEAFNTMTHSLRDTLERLSNRESLAAVGQFAASLAHEVRNPLTAIRLDLQRVQEALPPDFDLREDHDRAIAEIERLNDTVESALTSARTEPAREARVELSEPIRAAVRASAPAFAQASVELSLDLGDPAPSVLGDRGALEQLFLNLLRNAAEALTVGGNVEVTASEHGDHAVVVVCDSGPGIPSELLEKVFDPLFTTRPEGTGLGLTVARRVAAAHGGTLVLENAPSGGTRAVVTLPLAW